jgi:hypothetical protein
VVRARREKLTGGRRPVLETGNASGFLSTGSPIAHLGLGRATRLEALTIRWPSGKVQNLGPIVAIDRTMLGKRGTRNHSSESRAVIPGRLLTPSRRTWYTRL